MWGPCLASPSARPRAVSAPSPGPRGLPAVPTDRVLSICYSLLSQDHTKPEFVEGRRLALSTYLGVLCGVTGMTGQSELKLFLGIDDAVFERSVVFQVCCVLGCLGSRRCAQRGRGGRHGADVGVWECA